jgi:hypothetical protein
VAAARSLRLKVFETRLGFFDSVVAAPSQAAALRAWGVHQNLFVDGQARVTADVAATKAALEHPGAPLRRPAGSHEGFALDPDGLPSVARGAGGGGKSQRRRPRADRTALDRAKAALAKLDEDRKRQEAEFEDRQVELDAARQEAAKVHERARRKAMSAVEAAREAYRKAGGKT